MNWRKEVKKDSRFLYWYDIEGVSPVTVEIAGAERVAAYLPSKKEEQGEDEKKSNTLWCLRFRNAQKMLGVNVTNGTLIEHLHGENAEDWIGKKITLRVAECAGEKCIRVHAPGAKIPKTCRRFRYLDAMAEGGAS